VNKDIRLEEATKENSRILWEWRNHPKIRSRFFNSDPVSWEDHEIWFDKKIKDANTIIYIAVSGQDKVGVIRFESIGKETSVSVNLHPDCFGRGMGSVIIKLGTEKMLKENTFCQSVVARIKTGNVASRKAFMKAGYKVIAEKKNEVVCRYNPQRDSEHEKS